MLEGWEMPAATCEAIRCHHNPSAATTNPLEANLVHVADLLANHSGMGGFPQFISDSEDIDRAIFERLGLAAEFPYEELLAKVEEQFIDTIYLMVG